MAGKKKLLPIEEARKYKTELYGGLYIPVNEERSFFDCVCCGKKTTVSVAGNIIDIYCLLKKGKKRIPHCKLPNCKCIGIESCDYKDKVDVEGRDKMIEYLQLTIRSLLSEFDKVHIADSNESRKVVAEEYYASNKHETSDHTIDGHNYIMIKVLRDRIKSNHSLRFF